MKHIDNSWCYLTNISIAKKHRKNRGKAGNSRTHNATEIHMSDFVGRSYIYFV